MQFFFFIFSVFCYVLWRIKEKETRRRRGKSILCSAVEKTSRIDFQQKREVWYKKRKYSISIQKQEKNAITVKRVLLLSWNTNSRPLNWTAHFDNFPLFSLVNVHRSCKKTGKVDKTQMQTKLKWWSEWTIDFFTMHSIFVLLHSCQ